MSTQLDTALEGLDVALGLFASPVGTMVSPSTALPAAALDKLLHVIQKSIAVHEAQTGKPLDESQIHPRPLFTDEEIAAADAADEPGPGDPGGPTEAEDAAEVG